MDRVAGFHPVREALRARRRVLRRLLVREDRAGRETDEVLALARSAGIESERVGAAELARGLPAGIAHQGLVLEAGPLPDVLLEELVGARGAGEPGGAAGGRRLVALDHVQDPRNLGAVARVAEASGARGLLVTRKHAPPLGPVVSRASAGAVEHLPVCRVPNLARSLAWLKENGFWVMGAEAHDSPDLFATPDRIWHGDLVILLGAEGRGLRPGVAAHVDHRVRIPMVGRVESLNVSAAAAVVLFEAVRRVGASSRGDQVAPAGRG